jgi:hypothetical protein
MANRQDLVIEAVIAGAAKGCGDGAGRDARPAFVHQAGQDIVIELANAILPIDPVTGVIV